MPRNTPIIIYLAALCLSMTGILLMASDLPPRLATHFNAAGRANGWTSSGQFLGLMLFFIPSTSLLTPVVTFCLRFFSPDLLNVPRKDYWSQPQSYRQACDFLFYSSFWHSALTVGFLFGLFFLTVRANSASPPALDNVALYAVAGLFAAGTLTWIIVVFRFFLRSPRA